MEPTASRSELTAVSGRRIYSIDILRGVVMIIMALDHVRDYFHEYASTDTPTNLATTTPILFFTRWITHFCAPTFVFLAGISAFLSGRKKTKKELSVFLMKRGCWLIVAEILIVTMGWTFDPMYHVLIMQVIWVIGISMIVLGFLVWLPVNLILSGGLLIIFFHNMLDYAEAARQQHVSVFWEFAHHAQFTAIPWAPHHIFIIVYAFLPWMGIMMTGFGLGRLFTDDFPSVRRRKILFTAGAVALLLLIILRAVNLYGDPSPWSSQRNPVFTFLSFINLSKYPPSLDYILLTIGVALTALGCLDRVTKESFSFVRVIGRVPFFYYVLHIYLIHILTAIVFFIQGYTAKDMYPQSLPFMFRPDKFGFNLGIVYLIWISVILILYPLCKRYDRYKSTHSKWWLSYI